jgi:hypothetical protein
MGEATCALLAGPTAGAVVCAKAGVAAAASNVIRKMNSHRSPFMATLPFLGLPSSSVVVSYACRADFTPA